MPADTPECAAALPGSAGDLYAVSANAFEAFVCAWMSELPIEAEIIRFSWKVLTAAQGAVCAAAGEAAAPRETAAAGWSAGEEARLAAEIAAADRGDADVHTVLAAAYKVSHEIDRMRGFLRFSPDDAGVYIARCAPDHFVLPALASHFTLRFGEKPWAVIDEKRRIVLSRSPGGNPRLFELSAAASTPLKNDPWEGLWRQYHRTINNESRKNPNLQRQFIPERYWKYLPELGNKSGV
jgi:hypothetical protein